MKTIKATKIEKSKKVTKTPKPLFTVDMVDCGTVQELYAQFGFAKQRAGLAINNQELQAIMYISGLVAMDAIVDNLLSTPKIPITVKDGEKLVFDSKGNYKVKKANIFRRFWNWVTGK